MIWVIQNDPDCPPGLLEEVFQDRGDGNHDRFRVIRVFAGEPIPEGTDGLSGGIVLGGQMSVADTRPYPFLIAVKAWIRQVVDRDIPFLGICLGGQLLAEVYGGRVTLQSERSEKGCHTVRLTETGRADPLFSGLHRSFSSFQWHNDAFDLPDGARHLAVSDTCPFQAFRTGRSAYGVQFHPEVTPPIVADWSRKEADPGYYRDRFSENEAAYRAASLRFLSNFLKLTGPP